MADTLVAPAFCWVPPHATTAGAEVADLCKMVGDTPEPEQRLVFDAMYAENADGSAVAFEFGLVCARQNLKTFCFERAALYDALVLGETVLWTAHRLWATRETFRHEKAFADNVDEVRRRVKSVSETNGEEAIEFYNGGRILFRARGEGAGRSLTIKKLVIDEAYDYDDDDAAALMPTTATVHGAQIRYGSSAAKVQSDILRSLVARGRAGGDPSLSLVEFADVDPIECEQPECDHTFGTSGCCFDDRRRWLRANPMMGRRISEERIADYRRSMKPAVFGREILGHHDEAPSAGKIAMSLWKSRRAPDSAPQDPVVFGLDATLDLTAASIAVCGADAEKVATVEIVAAANGTEWVRGWFAERVGRYRPFRVAVDPSGPAGALLPQLEGLGLDLVTFTAREASQSCTSFLAAVNAGTMRHRDDPRLNRAVEVAVQRTTGEGWRWSRLNSRAGISELVAATNALWLFMSQPADYDVLKSFY